MSALLAEPSATDTTFRSSRTLPASRAHEALERVVRDARVGVLVADLEDHLADERRDVLERSRSAEELDAERASESRGRSGNVPA